MITHETILTLAKEDLPQFAEELHESDIRTLFAWLDEKEDQIRYKSLLLLQYRSQNHPDVYPYWDRLAEKFNSSNSYHRSIGLMLIADNVRWDNENKMDSLLDNFLALCDDEKPVTVRQCIQSLAKMIPYKPAALQKITAKLISINITERKETQRKILLVDILTILIMINKIQTSEKINQYINQAMLGGILDKKSRNELEFLIKN